MAGEAVPAALSSDRAASARPSVSQKSSSGRTKNLIPGEFSKSHNDDCAFACCFVCASNASIVLDFRQSQFRDDSMKVPKAARLVIAAAIVGVVPTFARADILSSKRGFGDTGANYNDLQASGAGWYYTWGTGPAEPGELRRQVLSDVLECPQPDDHQQRQGDEPDYTSSDSTSRSVRTRRT